MISAKTNNLVEILVICFAISAISIVAFVGFKINKRKASKKAEEQMMKMQRDMKAAGEKTIDYRQIIYESRKTFHR